MKVRPVDSLCYALYWIWHQYSADVSAGQIMLDINSAESDKRLISQQFKSANLLSQLPPKTLNIPCGKFLWQEIPWCKQHSILNSLLINADYVDNFLKNSVELPASAQ